MSKKIEKTCPKCGQKFATYISANKHFCSPECRYGYIKPKKQKQVLIKECPTCKNSFQVNKKRQIFCSYKCIRPRKGGNRKGTKQSEAVKVKCGIKPDDFSQRLKKAFQNNSNRSKKISEKAKERHRNYSLERKTEIANKIRIKVIKNYLEKPELIEIIRQKRLQQVIPKKDSKIEILLQQELKSRNIDFVTHPAIDITQPDIYLPKYKIIIFADGCYWHSCPKCLPLKCKTRGWTPEQIRQKDQLITERLIKREFIVMRFWEHDIKHSTENCINKVIEQINRMAII